MAFVNFSMTFLWAGSAYADSVVKIQSEILEPFFRNFLKHLSRQAKQITEVPASDRVVAVDHNSKDQHELEAGLECIETGMQESNSLRADADFDRSLAELSAARRLLQASTVRIAALQALLAPVLKWLGKQALGGAVAVAISAVIAILAKTFGIKIPTL